VGFKDSTIYRIWNPKIRGVRAVERSRDVIFDEDSLYDPKNPFPPELEDNVPEFIEPQNIVKLQETREDVSQEEDDDDNMMMLTEGSTPIDLGKQLI
jgi:hypothetical protein